MPIVETLGIALAACGVPVLLLQQLEQRRFGGAARDAGTAPEAHTNDADA